MSSIKLIALDLDGTLLNSSAHLSLENRKALVEANEKGIVIVPATGRLLPTIPQEIMDLGFIRYAIGMNGASVYDLVDNKEIYSATIDNDLACQMMREIAQYPVFYDCFVDGKAYVETELFNHAEDYFNSPVFKGILVKSRIPVDNMIEYISGLKKGIQKFQFITTNEALKNELKQQMIDKYPQVVVTSSSKVNAEMNHPLANKGEAVYNLAKYLNIDISEVMCFGDNANDVPMIKRAGIGVAMANGEQEAKEAADVIADTNDNDGVSKVIRQYCL